ncbi:LPS-assembly protein LptD [Candidatus Coxiella mudrowiae]|uniref:LPS-assembly protein LptD n=1 Tax=Candidatus Coxiella mudrowiae TaxID=2054173 RepID=UPI000C293CED|nr:LPS assembly protein LptD [Candidatus Coxiella mudrowiae]
MKLRNLFILVFFILTLLFQQLGVAEKANKATKISSSKQRLVSETLPEGWSRYRFQQHIANILGWIPTEGITLFCHGYFEEPLMVREFPHPAAAKKESTIITARGSSTVTAKGISILQKDVVVIQPSRVVNADKAYIYRDEKTGQVNKIVLVGHVRLREDGKLIVADKGKLTLHPKTAVLKNLAYRGYNDKSYIPQFNPFNAWGTAKQATRDASQVMTLQHATYSTCDPTSPTWWLSATTLVLNKQTYRGEAYNVLLRFYGFPVFYFPYYNFPIDNYRKTGFLTPRIGLSGSSGGLFSLPFYWNMAPNYDLTLTPELMSKRGLDMHALFRFLSATSSGEMYVSYLPDDTLFQRFREETLSKFSNPYYAKNPRYAPYLEQLKNMKNQRSLFSINEHTALNPEWSSNIILNYVTDPYFFQDLGGQMNASSFSNQLLNRIDLQYSGLHWQFNGMLQAYQTLHLISQISAHALDQYARLPDFNVDGYYPDITPHMDFNLNAEAINFSYQSNFTPDKPIGQRFHMRPGLSFPFYFVSGYINPQIWADATAYNVEHFQPGQVQTAGRLLPIFDIDSGLYFDRDFSLRERNFTQTLEPRFFYLYVPYQNQDKLPNFDTVLLPFAFEQLFVLNQYTGDDRLQNANQVIFGLTSRIFDGITGAPLLTANLGFMYLIGNQRVWLPAGCTPLNFHFSPIVSELIYYPFPHWSLTTSMAWNPNLRQTNNSSTVISYANERRKLSLGYIFVHGNGQSIVGPSIISPPSSIYSTNTSVSYLSVQWPLSAQWSARTYWGYDLTRHHTDVAAVGVQYNTCCWALSFITRRTYTVLIVDPVSGLKNSYDTSYFVQLELKGLGDFGNAPIAGQSLFNTIYDIPNDMR